MDPVTQNNLDKLYKAIQASKVSTAENIPANYAKTDAKISQLVEQKKKAVAFQTNANGIGKELNMYDTGTKLSDQWATLVA